MSTQSKSSDILSDVERKSYKAFFYASNLIGEAIERSLSNRLLESSVEYDVLYTLHEAPTHSLTIREIAANVTLSHSGLSRLINRMEQRGYVARCPVESDRRSVSVRLRETGLRRIDEVWSAIALVVQENFAQHLTTDEHLELIRLMDKMLPRLIKAKELQTGLQFIHEV